LPANDVVVVPLVVVPFVVVVPPVVVPGFKPFQPDPLAQSSPRWRVVKEWPWP
jgi:hypothetical protein